MQWIGIVVALAGIVLVSREPGPGRAPVVAAGVGLALVAALGFGLFVVGLGDAAQESAIVGGGDRAPQLGVHGRALALACDPHGRRACRSASCPLILAVGMFDAGANALIAVATTHGSIGIVAVLSALYPDR